MWSTKGRRARTVLAPVCAAAIGFPMIAYYPPARGITREALLVTGMEQAAPRTSCGRTRSCGGHRRCGRHSSDSPIEGLADRDGEPEREVQPRAPGAVGSPLEQREAPGVELGLVVGQLVERVV